MHTASRNTPEALFDGLHLHKVRILPFPALFAMDPTAPEISGYTLKSVLGTGASATVYLAQHHALQRDVALKVMSPAFSSDPSFCKRFLQEARDTALLSEHPNIVTIHDVGHTGSTYYIAMQYLPGQSLRQRLDAASSPLPPAVDVMKQLASALSQVHQKGYIHQDIKPANVLFNESGEAVLSDFGVARPTSKEQESTRQNTGTLRYMSPEQIQGSATIDGRSDLYSLGVLLYEILTGEPPYLAVGPNALMHMHLNDPIPTLPSNLTSYQSIVDRLMAKRVDQRYPTAEALLTDIAMLSERAKQQPPGTHTFNLHGTDVMAQGVDTRFTTLLGVAFIVLILVTGSLLFIRTQSVAARSGDARACPELSATQTLERDDLLELAQIYRDIGRLLHPPGANAMQAYRLALEIDPCNTDVTDALTQIRHEQSMEQ